MSEYSLILKEGCIITCHEIGIKQHIMSSPQSF